MLKTPIAHILQNEQHEGPELIADFLEEAGFSIQINHLYEEPFEAIQQADLVVMMGGSMSANEPTTEQAKAQQWLGQMLLEKRKVKFLGICLGAQTLAKALGAKVSQGKKGQEIGYWPVESSSFAQSVLGWPKQFKPLHWHGETYELPKGAECLGSSEAYAQQGFLWQNRVLGLQFHLEANYELLTAFVEKAYPDPNPQDQYHQGQAEVIALGKEHENKNKALLFKSLERFLALQGNF